LHNALTNGVMSMKRLIISLLALSSILLAGAAQAEGSVARAIVTTGVADREPVNDLERVMAGNQKVLFFTELRGMEGQTVKHRWSHGDESLAEVEFKVGGPRWRVWSSKNLMPEWAGEWKVEVVDSADNVVSEKSFSYAGDGSIAETAAATEEAEVVETPAAEAPAAEAEMHEMSGDAPAAEEAAAE
jgi:hypothetical protein